MHVGFENHTQLNGIARPNLIVQIGQLDTALHDQRFGSALRLALIDDLFGGALVFEDLHRIAGARQLDQTENLDREARIGPANALAAIVEHRFDAAPGGARHHDVTQVERATLDEQRGDRTAIAVDLGFDHDTAGQLVRIRLELVDIGDEQDDLALIVMHSKVLGDLYKIKETTGKPILTGMEGGDIVGGNDYNGDGRPDVVGLAWRSGHDEAALHAVALDGESFELMEHPLMGGILRFVAIGAAGHDDAHGRCGLFHHAGLHR